MILSILFYFQSKLNPNSYTTDFGKLVFLLTSLIAADRFIPSSRHRRRSLINCSFKFPFDGDEFTSNSTDDELLLDCSSSKAEGELSRIFRMSSLLSEARSPTVLYGPRITTNSPRIPPCSFFYEIKSITGIEGK